MNRKVIISIIVVAFLIVGGLVGYNLSLQKKNPEAAPGIGTEITDENEADLSEEKENAEVSEKADKAVSVYSRFIELMFDRDYSDTEGLEEMDKKMKISLW